MSQNKSDNKRRFTMNEDIFKGQWRQIRGKAREWWGELTDDDLDMVDGRWDQMVGKLQEKYGYTKEKAASELETRLKELEEGTPTYS